MAEETWTITEFSNEIEEISGEKETRRSARLFINHVLQLEPHKKTDHYNFHGLPLRHAFLQGVITEKKPYGDKFIYTVDDGSGEIGCIYDHLKHEETFQVANKVLNGGVYIPPSNDTISNNKPYETDEMREGREEIIKFMCERWKEMIETRSTKNTPYRVGDTIKCYGRIHEFNGRRQVWIYDAFLITNFDEETLWKNEVNFMCKHAYSKLKAPTNV